MSFTENDRKFRSKIGKSFPSGDGYDSRPFALAIAGALKADFGSAPSAVKRVARLTTANERTVRNWFEGKNGPSGENLVSLMQHSDAVLGVALALSGRGQVAAGLAMVALRDQLVAAVAIIDAAAPDSS
ncbi:MAG: hypothetical protein ACXWKR_04290 [Phenylobacterium sp.]